MTLRSSFVALALLVAIAVISAHAAEDTAAVGSRQQQGTISGVLKLPGGQNIRFASQMQPRPLATITLHSPTLTLKTAARADGHFTFHQVPDGVYMLTAEFAHLVFPAVRVSLVPSRTGALRIRAMINDGSQVMLDADGTVESPISLVALGRHAYFVPREEVSFLSFLKNPMIIMMIVSVGMMGLMKLVPQEELRQQMKDMNQQVQQSKEQLGLETKKSS
jgi:hypothetical protein